MMDEPHLLAAAHYVALDPVVAGWCAKPGTGHGRAPARLSRPRMTSWQRGAPLRALIRDLAGRLAAPGDPATTAPIEWAPTIGRPLGAPEWIAALDRRLGRPSHPVNPNQRREWTVRPSARSGCGRFKSTFTVTTHIVAVAADREHQVRATIVRQSMVPSFEPIVTRLTAWLAVVPK